MAVRTNPYGLSVDLNVEDMAIEASVLEKASGEVVDSHVFPVEEVHESLRPHTALYGYSKLLQDRSSDTKTGPDKLAAMKLVAEQLAAGQWQKERKVGAPTVSAEVEALAQLKQISIPKAQASLRAYDKEQREKILANPRIVELAAQIREARSQEEIESLDDLAAEPAPAAATA